MMAVVNVFIRVSTALWRRQTRVKAVPISFDAPEYQKGKKVINEIDLKGNLIFKRQKTSPGPGH